MSYPRIIPKIYNTSFPLNVFNMLFSREKWKIEREIRQAQEKKITKIYHICNYQKDNEIIHTILYNDLLRYFRQFYKTVNFLDDKILLIDLESVKA